MAGELTAPGRLDRNRLATGSAAIVASDWVPIERNTLRGLCTLRLPSGLVLRDCSVHQQGARRWIGLPGRPQIDTEGKHRTDSATGRKLYTPTVEIPDPARRERFQAAALAAVDRLLASEAAP
jgi:hypothetical protein